MSAGHVDLNITKGSKFTKTFIWEDASGSAISLNGYNAEMHIRKYIESAAYTISLTNGNGKLILENNGNTGYIDIVLDRDDTDLLSAGRSVYELQLVDTLDSKNVIPLVEGNITIIPDITI